jgi:pimeloyl-ACP methyl ester carboxylesterase
MTITAPPLVLLPGLDGTGELFAHFVGALPEGVTARVVRYPADKPLSLSECVAIVRAAIGNDRVILVAESFSGLVALQLLREGGVDVEKVIFVASFAAPPRPFLIWMKGLLPLFARGAALLPKVAWRFFCLGAGASKEEILWLRGVVTRVPSPVVAHRLSLVAETVFEAVPPLGVPAFYLQPRDDKLVPASAAAALRPFFREFTLVQVEGPHFVLQARPQECATEIMRLVANGS